MHDSRPNSIILYDGVCGLCNRVVQFVLKRDNDDRYRFASLQSEFAGNILRRHRVQPGQLDTFYILLDATAAAERLLSKSDAVVSLLGNLRSFWRVAGRLVQLIPRFARNAIYDVVANNRYRIFGRYDSCPLPSERDRAKFLDSA